MMTYAVGRKRIASRVEINAEEFQFGKRGARVQSRFARVLCTVLGKWNPATKKEITDKVNGWFSSSVLGF